MPELCSHVGTGLRAVEEQKRRRRWPTEMLSFLTPHGVNPLPRLANETLMDD
jgi:hypothetical protein